MFQYSAINAVINIVKCMSNNMDNENDCFMYKVIAVILILTSMKMMICNNRNDSNRWYY